MDYRYTPDEIGELNVVIEQLRTEIERLRAALERIASYYANGAVLLNSDIDVPEIARAALEPKP